MCLVSALGPVFRLYVRFLPVGGLTAADGGPGAWREREHVNLRPCRPSATRGARYRQDRQNSPDHVVAGQELQDEAPAPGSFDFPGDLVAPELPDLCDDLIAQPCTCSVDAPERILYLSG